MSFPNDFFTCGSILSLDQGRILIGWGKRKWLHEPSTNPCWYFPDFFLQNPLRWFAHESVEIRHLNEFKIPSLFSCSSAINWSNFHELLFEEAFLNLKNLIADKILVKGVPYLFEEAAFKVTPLFIKRMLFSVLKHASVNNSFIYGFWDEQDGLLGLTPELLFSYDSKKLKSMACAATIPLNSILTTSQKLKLDKEHAIVVDEITKNLSKLGKVQVKNSNWEKFHTLKHLITHLDCSLECFDFEKIVKSLHPTSAVGAFPRKKGWEWLLNYEKKLPRGRYAAPLGAIFQEKATCFVGIRNVQWNSGQMRIGAGCGIVEESLLEEEKKEVLAKISAIKGILCL